MQNRTVEPRLPNPVNDLLTGSYYGVFIDDTGSPGLASTPANLHPERKTWVGVVVKPHQMPEVLHQFPQALNGLYEFTGAKEFHFADIYAGKGEFKDVDFQIRLSLFEFMVDIFCEYDFPIYVQTFDPNTLSTLRSARPRDFPENVGMFDMTKQNDVALLLLIMRIKWFIEKDRSNANSLAYVFADEGYKKNGMAIEIPSWKSVFKDGCIYFARSSDYHPLQLADFAAFVLNRSQLLIGKQELNERDKQLLTIIEPLCNNFRNISKIERTLE